MGLWLPEAVGFAQSGLLTLMPLTPAMISSRVRADSGPVEVQDQRVDLVAVGTERFGVAAGLLDVAEFQQGEVLVAHRLDAVHR